MSEQLEENSLQRTLMGVSDTESSILDIIHGIGHKMCARECYLRRGECRSITYDAEHVVCTLHSSPFSGFADDGKQHETVSDTSKPLVRRGCADVECGADEKCIQLSAGTKCVRQDMPRDCRDLKDNDEDTGTGVHVIFPFLPETTPVPALCDMEHGEGGYTVIQRRVDGSENFTRFWTDYKHGFGDLGSEFWLGNDVIHSLTNRSASSLYVLLQNHNGALKYASFSTVYVSGEHENYAITLGTYDGTAGNSLSNCEASFSTLDRDNDEGGSHCVTVRGQGGWWFHSCCRSNLNGVYCAKNEKSAEKCNRWYSFDGNRGMKESLMMTRRHN